MHDFDARDVFANVDVGIDYDAINRHEYVPVFEQMPSGYPISRPTAHSLLRKPDMKSTPEIVRDG